MGGIPTNIHGQVISREGKNKEGVVEGIYAVGECASVSVHGSNRLGSNSLLDLIVFGRAAGIHLEQSLRQGLEAKSLNDEDLEKAMKRYNRWEESKKGESFQVIRTELKKVIQDDFGVFREAKSMQSGMKKLLDLRKRLDKACLSDKTMTFNNARIEALEMDNLMTVAMATAVSAMARNESRGAHSREDFTKRDDDKWLKHTVYYLEDDALDYRPVNMKPENIKMFKPKPREL